jgi:hypothetical protein
MGDLEGDNIIMDVREVGCEDGWSVLLAYNRVQWCFGVKYIFGFYYQKSWFNFNGYVIYDALHEYDCVP